MNKIDPHCAFRLTIDGKKRTYYLPNDRMYKIYRSAQLQLKKKIKEVLDQFKISIEQKTDARCYGRGPHDTFILFDKYRIQTSSGMRYFQVYMDLDLPTWPTILLPYKDLSTGPFDDSLIDRMTSHPEYDDVKFEDMDLKIQHLVNAINKLYHMEE